MCAAMKEQLSRQMFEVVIQAAANGKIIARETMKVRYLSSHCNLIAQPQTFSAVSNTQHTHQHICLWCQASVVPC